MKNTKQLLVKKKYEKMKENIRMMRGDELGENNKNIKENNENA